MSDPTDARIAAWLDALEARYTADLRPAEVARALRALSSTYVERRGRLARGAALDGAGKRAAFALYYGPMHFVLVRHVLDTLGAQRPRAVLDLGCGTGVAGAAWALHGAGTASVVGVDRHPWAVDEARWTYRMLGLDGTARQGDVVRIDPKRPADAIVAAYVLNELDDERRAPLLTSLLARAFAGTAVLIIEPVARTAAPWLGRWIETAQRSGGRVDEWRVSLELPPIVRRLEAASGLDASITTARTVYWPAAAAAPSSAPTPR